MTTEESLDDVVSVWGPCGQVRVQQRDVERYTRKGYTLEAPSAEPPAPKPRRKTRKKTEG